MHPSSTLSRASTARTFRVGEWTVEPARCSLAQRRRLGAQLAALGL